MRPWDSVDDLVQQVADLSEDDLCQLVAVLLSVDDLYLQAADLSLVDDPYLQAAVLPDVVELLPIEVQAELSEHWHRHHCR